MTKKRIFIDLTDLVEWSGNHGGTQRVVYWIAKKFYENNDISKNSVNYIRFDINLNQYRYVNFNELVFRVEGQYYDLNKYNNLKIKLYSNKLVRIKENDIFLILGKPWDYPKIQPKLNELKKDKNIKIVQLVYDLIICLYPHLHNEALYNPYRRNTEALCENSDAVLSISQSTADDLKYFAKLNNLRCPKIKVIRLGDDFNTKTNINPIKPSDRIKGKFIACIGTLEIRKNHTLLYYTYKLAQDRGLELPQLVIIGSYGWHSEDIRYLFLNDKTLNENIILLNDVDDSGLEWIYDNCIYTIYPSFYEGWGLPVAESISRGKICLASNSSSIPEIAGNLIPYFSPYDSNELLGRILNLNSSNYRGQLETNIKNKYKTHTWHDTYIKINEVINEL